MLSQFYEFAIGRELLRHSSLNILGVTVGQMVKISNFKEAEDSACYLPSMPLCRHKQAVCEHPMFVPLTALMSLSPSDV